jgi:hypothetical protein
MSFSADWLALREPFDRQARNRDVLDAVFAFCATRPSLTIADLACGTGSTLRTLSPHIKGRQHWRLFDNDLSLLARAPESVPPQLQVQTVPIDLNRDLELALDGLLDFVTTSALLDLVSDEWLERFAVEAAVRHVPVYAALSYDGRAMLSPIDPMDEAIVDAVNRHQHTNKGFGSALGPDAARAAVARFKRVGYEVTSGESDWVFSATDKAIQHEMVAGWAFAAQEIGESSLDVAGWLARRREYIDAGRSSIRVGHVDLFATPNGMR